MKMIIAFKSTDKCVMENNKKKMWRCKKRSQTNNELVDF